MNKENRVNILGIEIQDKDYSEITDTIIKSVNEKSAISITYINTYNSQYYLRHTDERKYLSKITGIYPDGAGIFLASKFLYGKNGLKKRITGTDLYFHIFKIANERRWRVYLLGGGEKTKILIKKNFKNTYPNIILTGLTSRKEYLENKNKEMTKIPDSDIIMISLGTPYQEKWIYENFERIKIPVQIAAGSGLEFISGAKKRAPVFMQKIGFEWLYRFFLEPKRLFYRYFIGNPVFILKIILQKFSLLKLK